MTLKNYYKNGKEGVIAMTINDKLNRYFMLVKGALAIAPILAYFYVSVSASMMQSSLQDILALNPSLTIIFITSMINPYIAYLIGIGQKKLETGEYEFLVLNMTLIMVALCLSQNVFYIFMVGFLFYQTVRIYRLEVGKILKSITLKQYFSIGGGSFIVIFIYMLCLFISFRIS